MRLLYYENGYKFAEYSSETPPYTILSHTWSENNDDEMLYEDIVKKPSKDLTKLDFCRDRTLEAGYRYFWVDTCCIDKRNDAELSYAIRSMYRWYSQAAICFVYLSDISKKKRRPNGDWHDSLKHCRWFTRGWTLQELVAPKNVEFYAQDGHLGNKQTLMSQLIEITGIDLSASQPGHRDRLGWINQRTTRRPEDKAYCMMGICDVMVSPMYGEGESLAWERLEAAIVQRYGTVAMKDDDKRSKSTGHQQSILDLLSFDQMDSRRTTISPADRKTCRWILKETAFVDWLNAIRPFIWIKGKPGAGKSVMVKFLDEHVGKEKPNIVRLTFYFTARGEELEKTFIGMYRALLVQLVHADPNLRHILDQMQHRRAFNVSQLQSALADGIHKLTKPVYCFIDAVDECSDQDIQQLVDFFENLQSGRNDVFVCFASRHYPVYEIPNTTLQLTLEEAVGHQADLHDYVRSNLRLGKATIKKKQEIIDAVVGKANGVFLWVVLVVKILSKDVLGGRLHAIRDRLSEIPSGLTELFQDILRRDHDDMDDFILCLRWLLYAKRPMSLPEFYFAMMASDHNRSLEWLQDDITEAQMHDFLTTSSKGFAERTRGRNQTAQFIHESVRDFLVKDNGFEIICRGSVQPSEVAAHEELKLCCQRGLSFALPDGYPSYLRRGQEPLSSDQRNALSRQYPFANYASTYYLHHADHAAAELPNRQNTTNSTALGLCCRSLNVFQKHKIAIYDTTPSLTYMCAERNLSRLPFPPYNALQSNTWQRYLTPLIAAYHTSSWTVLRLLFEDLGFQGIEQIMEEAMQARTTFKPPLSSANFVNWRWAIRNGLEHLTKALTGSVPVSELTTPVLGKYPIHLAIDASSVAVVEHLLSIDITFLQKLIPYEREAWGHSECPLLYAARHGSTEVLEVLLRAVPDIPSTRKERSKSTFPGPPIREGVSLPPRGKILELLPIDGLNKLSTLDALSAVAHRRALSKKAHTAALDCVARLEYDCAVQLLLEAGSYYGKHSEKNIDSAIYDAARQGHIRTLQTLLGPGVNVNAQIGSYGNALAAAAHTGNPALIKLLLKAGANVNAQGGLHGSALQAAASCDEDALVMHNADAVCLLLKNGADANVQGGRYGNALQAAVASNNEQAYRALLSAGADVNAQGGHYGTALQAAAACGNSMAIYRLLEAGADINAHGGKYGTALQAAAACEKGPAVTLLLKAGADVNARGGGYGNALQAAVYKYKYDSQIIQALIAAGADVNAQDGPYGNVLQAAIMNDGHVDDQVGLIRILLDAGAKIHVKNCEFESALEAALQKENEPIVQLLLDHDSATGGI